MTRDEIADQYKMERKFVPPVSPWRMGADAASQGAFLDSCPFSESDPQRRQFIDGYLSIVNELADADTAAYLGSLDNEPGYSESMQAWLW